MESEVDESFNVVKKPEVDESLNDAIPRLDNQTEPKDDIIARNEVLQCVEDVPTVEDEAVPPVDNLLVNEESVNGTNTNAENEEVQNTPAAEEPVNENKEEPITSQPISSLPPISSSTTPKRVNTDIVETIIEYFLNTNAEELDDRHVRELEHKLGRMCRPPIESQYEKLAKVMISIKSIKDRAIFNDALSLMHKIFEASEFNRFVVIFWEELKKQDINPFGYSYTGGQAKFNYNGVQHTNNDPQFLDDKARELAWSLLLDIEATLDTVFESCVFKRLHFIYHLILLRRLRCLGDFKMDIEGEKRPIFVFFFRKLLNLPAVQESDAFYETMLSVFSSLAWAPMGIHCWSSMSPNDVLTEIMENIDRDDRYQFLWITALNNLLNPLERFRCRIVWNRNGTGYDNPDTFFKSIVKCSRSTNTLVFTEELKRAILSFKASIRFSGILAINVDNWEEHEKFEWTFGFWVAKVMDIQNLPLRVPFSIYKYMPLNELYTPMENTPETLDDALIAIFELHFYVGADIPKELHQGIWQAYEPPKSIIEAVARALVKTLKKLEKKRKCCVNKDLNCLLVKLLDSIDKSGIQLMCSALEMDVELILGCQSIFVLGRAVRFAIFDEYERIDRRRIKFLEMNKNIQAMFDSYAFAATEKFNILRDKFYQSYPPWRLRYDDNIPDDQFKAMLHFLSAVQTEANCFFEMTGDSDEKIVDFLLFLYRKRKMIGVGYGKADSYISEKFPPPREFDASGNMNESRGNENMRNHDRYENHQSSNRGEYGRSHGSGTNYGQRDDRNRNSYQLPSNYHTNAPDYYHR